MSSTEKARGVRRVDRVRATIRTDAPRVTAGLRLLGYVRRSQDSGTGVSEEIQQHKIEQWAALYEHEVTFLPPDLDESSWTLDRPGLKKALDLLAKGEYDGIVVAFQDRLTRRTRDFCDLLERAENQGWHVFAVDTYLDTTKDSTLHEVLADFLGGRADVQTTAWEQAARLGPRLSTAAGALTHQLARRSESGAPKPRPSPNAPP